VGTWLVVVGAASALAITLAPSGDHSAAQELARQLDLRDFILNLGLLVPVGAGLGLRRWPLWAVLACALLLSGGIELLQLLLPIGRDANLLDIVANTAGAGMAAWVAPRIPQALGVSATTARWLVAGTLLAWCVQLVLTACALQRDMPVTPQYYGQWSHVFTNMVALAGEVTDFSIQGRPIPDDVLPDTDALRAALAAGDSVTVFVTVTDLGPSPGRAQVAGVSSDAGDLVTGVEREGCRIRFRWRTRGERLGLRPLSVTLPTSCDLESGVTTISGRASHASLAIAAAWGGEVRQATLALTPSLGWRLFVERGWRGGAWDVVGSIVWLALWGAPLALWLQAAWPRNVVGSLLLYVVGLLGATFLVGLASGLAMGTPGDLVGAALGWWVGVGRGWKRPLGARPIS